MRVIFPQEMEKVDADAVNSGIPALKLMENAGKAVADIARTMLGTLEEREILILCGKGKNAGDGLVAARYLSKGGAEVKPVLFFPEDQLHEDTMHNFEALDEVAPVHNKKGLVEYIIKHEAPDLIIDAVFGTGFHGNIREPFSTVFSAVNNSGIPVLSIDIPSGVDASSGDVRGKCLKAAVTVTFVCPKIGHFLFPGASYRGKLVVKQIGISHDLVEKHAEGRISTMDRNTASRLIPRFPIDAHKGSRGKVLIIAGSIGFGGAAILTAMGAFRAGAGLVALAIPDTIYEAIESKLTEVIKMPFQSSDIGTISVDSAEDMIELSTGFDSVAIGPGIGVSDELAELLDRLTKEISVPVVIDADGLNNIIESTETIRKRSASTVLTPHPGEMARLFKLSVEEVEKDRPAMTLVAARKFRAVVALKGAFTLIANPAGELSINTSGNPGMATAGSGDVLTGIIAAFLAQDLSAYDAVRLGVFIHGEAGDIAASEIGEVGFMAGEISDRIPRAMSRKKTRIE